MGAAMPTPMRLPANAREQMKASGIDVISFGAGEPDFNTPEHIKEAGIAAIQANQTRYTPAAGVLPLDKVTGCHYNGDRLSLENSGKQFFQGKNVVGQGEKER